MTLAELAGRVGTSPPQISRLEKGERKLTKEWANRLAPELDCAPQNLVFGQAAGLAVPPQSPHAAGDKSDCAPRDVPVYQAAFCNDGIFSKVIEEPVDYVHRLPRIAQARNVFALYTANDSMEPRFEQGDILYVNPGQPPKPGDYVMIELLDPAKQNSDRGYIKRLISLTKQWALVEQFNPPGRFELDSAKIRVMFRIIPWNELASG